MNYTFQLEEETIEINTRLDKCISELVEEISRTAAQNLIQEQQITVNGNIEKVSYRVKGDETIEIHVPDPIDVAILPQDIPLDIIYEDRVKDRKRLKELKLKRSKLEKELKSLIENDDQKSI